MSVTLSSHLRMFKLKIAPASESHWQGTKKNLPRLPSDSSGDTCSRCNAIAVYMSKPNLSVNGPSDDIRSLYLATDSGPL